MKKNGIDIFLENNKGVQIEEKGKKVIVSNCWGDDSFHFEFKNKATMAFLKTMVFPKDLFAIYHKDKNLYEFVFLFPFTTASICS